MTYEPTQPTNPERAPNPDPRIYVASLSDYNAGRLHGTWLGASADIEGMEAGIALMLAASPETRQTGQPAEEWAIHDYEDWAGIRLDEYENLATVARLAEGLRAHGAAFAAWVELVGTGLGSGSEDFEDHYIGEFDSLSAYGESVLEDFGVSLDNLSGIPEGLRQYVHIDVAGWTRDMALNSEIEVRDGELGIYVFYPLTMYD